MWCVLHFTILVLTVDVMQFAFDTFCHLLIWCNLHFTLLVPSVDVMQFAFHTFSAVCWCVAVCFSHFLCGLFMLCSLHFTILVLSVWCSYISRFLLPIGVKQFAFHTFSTFCWFDAFCISNFLCRLLMCWNFAYHNCSAVCWCDADCISNF